MLRAALRRRTKYTLVIVSIAVGVLACLWVMRFLWLLTMGNELIILPSRSRIPDLPSGAAIVAEDMGCGSGGCWREITVAPAAGQSPEDLAQEMNLSEEQHQSPTLFDPGFVYVWAHPRDGQLVLGIGYQ
ncbi:hypothetical protein BC793_1723 [Actinoplanes xinjiangensis]|uniref:Uncharacterized protein n=2 Tax=Actinoplanes xinjiangensis TaxID=512350 RepID=A0A316E3Y5_9ACTN|nr:hypothetical protein BC793_1723 [Actinoplanes xinjiangensis]GIF45159.1 hypothetical protein Axi01nite_94700 [Actinoplanes xinjiangensis]